MTCKIRPAIHSFLPKVSLLYLLDHPGTVVDPSSISHSALMTSSTYTTLSRPHPAVWQIALTSPPDNRLTPDLLASLSSHLDTVEAEWRRSSGTRDEQGPMSDPGTFGEHKGAGAVIITGTDRFFSNGLDYSKAMANKHFFEGKLCV